MKAVSTRKSFLALVMALLMTIALAAPAMAADTEEPEVPVDDPAPISSSYNFWTTARGGTWGTVLSDSGLSCNVRISILGTDYRVGVRMLSGSTVVWTDTNAFASTTSRTFWCGSNVTSVQVCLFGPLGESLGSWVTESIHVEAPV